MRSDQAARTDWETFAVEGVRIVEERSVASKSCQPIAPTFQIFLSGQRPKTVPLPESGEFICYRRNGVGLSTSTATYTPYKSNRVTNRADGAPLPKPFEAELIRGVSAYMRRLATPRDRHRADGAGFAHRKGSRKARTKFCFAAWRL